MHNLQMSDKINKMKKLSNQLKKLPQKPGVYLFKDKTGRILYIGKAVNLRSRVRSHFSTRNNSPSPPLILRGGIEKITDLDWMETDDEKQAYLLENELIKKYKPRYNIQWRDDKSYFWVMLTDEEWPRVKIVHQRQALSAERQAQIIGPFVNGRELRQLLRALRKIFPYRTCKNPYNKPCLQWHLGLCPAHGSKGQIANGKKEKNPPQSPFYKGGSNASSPLLKRGAGGDFEQGLKKYLNFLKALSQFLRLYAGEPIRIEAYDISNIHGVWATGSMIVFYGNKPRKSDYRRFKIKTVAGANDVAMLKEILKRRFGHPEWPMPDLILVDGGIAQLHAARLEVGSWKLEVPIFALAKIGEEIYTEYSDKVLKLNALPTEMKLIFQAIRNEAHRFAIFYYRHLHGKEFRNRTNSKKTRTKNQKTA